MEYIRGIFKRYNIKMYRNNTEIDFETIKKLEMIENEKQANANRCKGYYKTTGLRCKTRVETDYCNVHKMQQTQSYELPEIETVSYRIPLQSELDQVVIDNRVYYLDRSSNELYKNNNYIGRYDEKFMRILESQD
jgi:hypothetical protein